MLIKWGGPPPTILLHVFSGLHKAITQFFKHGVIEVKAHDHASRPYPTQSNALLSQIVLKHPVIPARHVVQHRPHSFHAGNSNRQLGFTQAAVEHGLSVGPLLTGVGHQVFHFRRVESVQKHIHGRHDGGVGIEGAACKTNIAGAVVTEALHPSRIAAQHANGQTAAQGLAIGNHIGVHAKVSLRAAFTQTETQKHFVKYKCNAFFCAHFAQCLQPCGVGLTVVMHSAFSVNQGAVRGGRTVGVHGLQGVDQHAGDVVAVTQDAQGVGMHIVQGEGVAGRWHGVARARLHIVPPAVVRPSEANNFSLFAVVSGQAHRLHHGFGARHVKRHLVFARQLTQPLDVIQDTRVIAAQHGAQFIGHGCTFGHAGLVKIVAKQVHAIRAGDVDKLIAVHVGQIHVLASVPEIAQLQMFGEHFAKLVGHAVLTGQLHVRNHGLGLSGMRQGLGAALFECLPQPSECGFTHLADGFGCSVDTKPSGLRVAVSRQPVGKSLGHAQVPAQRWMFCQRQLQALPNSRACHQQSRAQHHRHTQII